MACLIYAVYYNMSYRLFLLDCMTSFFMTSTHFEHCYLVKRAWISFDSLGVCEEYPCLNDGICEADGDTYKCECVQRYFGNNCQCT